jgi:spermidine/putrescine transport system substrate-binding protein
MSNGQDLSERRLSREELLKLAVVAGGAGLLAGRASVAGAALERLSAESGQLQVLDWAGYGYDGGQAMFAQYLKKYPGEKPKFTNMTSETNALAKMSQGLKPDVVRPYVGYVRDFAESGFVQPWNPKLISNLKDLNPNMVKAGRYKGKQYGIPADWGFDAILYRTDKVKPKELAWSLLWDERYAGKISWWDDLYMLVVAGYALGVKNPWQQTTGELKRSQQLLASAVKKHIPRLFWSDELAMQTAFAAGDIWIVYAWPADWAAMKSKGLKVRYVHPKEGAISWIGMFMQGKDTPRPEHAHAYVDAWSSKQSGTWLENNYAYGHANTLSRPKSKDLLRALQLTNPNALREPNAHIDRYIPNRQEYAKRWQEVKAAG